MRSPANHAQSRSAGVDQSKQHEEGKRGLSRIRTVVSFALLPIANWLVSNDTCTKDESHALCEEDLLFCTLCNAEVNKYSKHCRSCDKCVEGFDHHCRWLNNCIGRKNYVSFVSLMVACLLMLFFEALLGLLVLVRCFTDKHAIQKHLRDKVGNVVSMAPFSALVALCTLTPLLASVPLGELLLFHMVLIRKGITTYEYVVAMRARNEPQSTVKVEQQNNPLVSNTEKQMEQSLMGISHHGAGCSPPTIEQRGEAVSWVDHGKLPCTVDADATNVVERKGYKARNIIKISALKLAKLNPMEAAQAATKARESSSVLRPVWLHSFGTSKAECGPSCSLSTRSSMSIEPLVAGNHRKVLRKEVGSPFAPSLSPQESSGKDERDVEIMSAQSSSSASSAPLSPLPAERKYVHANTLKASPNGRYGLEACRNGLPVCNATIPPRSSLDNPSWICTTPINEGYETSRAMETVQLGTSHIISIDKESWSSSRSLVYWDRAAGRFRPVLDRTHLAKASQNCPAESPGPFAPVRPYSLLSPGKFFASVNVASFDVPLSMRTPRNCGKENCLKWTGDNTRPAYMQNHIVLPSQNSSGLFRYQSSVSASRRLPKDVMISRFTPS